MKKKSDGTNKNENPKKVDNEEEVMDPKLTWVQIIMSLGKPLWDADLKKWRVLNGYQSVLGNQQNQLFFEVTFTDTPYWESFLQKNLYFNIPKGKENIKNDGDKGGDKKSKRGETKDEG